MVWFERKDGIAHESSFIIGKVMICLILGFPCWILTNYKSSTKCPAGQLSQISSVISWEPKTIKNRVLSPISGLSHWQLVYCLNDFRCWLQHNFKVTFKLFLVLQFVSTFGMFFNIYISARKHHKTLSCNLFGVHVSLVHILTLLIWLFLAGCLC